MNVVWEKHWIRIMFGGASDASMRHCSARKK